MGGGVEVVTEYAFLDIQSAVINTIAEVASLSFLQSAGTRTVDLHMVSGVSTDHWTSTWSLVLAQVPGLSAVSGGSTDRRHQHISCPDMAPGTVIALGSSTTSTD